jgi:hypothetical protein
MLTFDGSKTVIFEMPKTGTTWLRQNLQDWRQGTTLRNVCPRHAQPEDFAEALNPEYRKILIFREPLEWCVSFWEYHNTEVEVPKAGLPVSRHYAHHELFGFNRRNQAECWEHLLSNPGRLSRYFFSFINYADLIIPFTDLREAFHLLKSANYFRAYGDLLTADEVNVGKGEWKTGEFDTYRTYIEHNERELFQRYRQCVTSWKITKDLLKCST